MKTNVLNTIKEYANGITLRELAWKMKMKPARLWKYLTELVNDNAIDERIEKSYTTNEKYLVIIAK